MRKNIIEFFEFCGGAVRIAAKINRHQYTVEYWKVSGIPDIYFYPLHYHYGLTKAEFDLFNLKIRKKRQAA